ncbi:MAG TPA: acetoacetate decarboxylase family protein [Acidimicrobiia bacterium]|nr:acetoacetate decarboxylase family protein [Acidimicrobiia bacterium]
MNPPQIIIQPVVPRPATPSYVEHGGELSNRHPAAAENARMYGFVIEADGDRLDDWCDVCLNEPSGGAENWRAAGDFVLLDFIDIPTLHSVDPLDAQLGSTSEHEVALWMPVVDWQRGRTAWAIPYIWVDSGYAMAGGRETYGFPKQLGQPTIPRTGDAPDALSLDVVTLETFATTSTASAHRVVTAARPGAVQALDESWTDPAGALGDLLALAGNTSPVADFLFDPMGALGAMAADSGTIVMFFADLVRRSLPVVLLKQFRDAVRPGLACYQGIIEVATRLDQFQRGGFLPADYQVTFEELAGQPVHRELGLSTGPLTPPVAFWLEFDFTVLLGRVLWEA